MGEYNPPYKYNLKMKKLVMLTVQELIDIFKNSKMTDSPPEPSSLSKVMDYVDIDTGVDESGLNYYFRIKLSELSKSEISNEIIYDMVENGWILSKDKKYVENFYQ